MSLSTQPYKGTRDFYPEDCRIQRHLFETMRKVASRYCYQEYDGPGATEMVALFDRASALDDGEFVQALVFDPSVMRGMDYYTGTVFEIFDVSPENRRAMFGGGRYDNLVGMFGGAELSGVGFGMGDVTLRHFLEVHGLLPAFGTFCDVFVSLPKPELLATTQKVAGVLRGAGLRVMTALEPSGFGAQLKLAAKHQARFVVLLGDDELARGEVAIKDLTTGSQECIKLVDLSDWGSGLSQR